MGVTISTHNGSAVAREHNIRNPKVVSKEAHIKPNGKFEIWHDEKPRNAYNRLFGQALEEYNNKQKRADRKIKDYYRHICDDKVKHPVYEMIVAIGSRNNSIDEETGYSILREFYNGWKERNPNLELIGAYYHADEDGVPHVHIDYVPVATGYINGMNTQSALVKALGQQGFKKEGKATAQIQWEKRENIELERLCNLVNIEVEHPLIEGRKHLSTKIYKLQQELIIADSAVKSAEEKFNYLQGQILTTEKVNAIQGKKSITGALKGISYEEYLSLKKTAEYIDKIQADTQEKQEKSERIIQQKEDIISNAHTVAENIINSAEQQANAIISNTNEVIAKAEQIIQQRKDIISNAHAVAESIINSAKSEATQQADMIISGATQRNNQLKRTIGKRITDLAELDKRLEQKKNDISNAEKIISEKKDEQVQAKQQEEQVKRAIDELQKQIAIAEKRKADLQSEIEEYEKILRETEEDERYGYVEVTPQVFKELFTRAKEHGIPFQSKKNQDNDNYILKFPRSEKKYLAIAIEKAKNSQNHSQSQGRRRR